MTRGVLFDLYGVIMRTQSPEAIAAIEAAAGFGGPELWDAFWALRHPYDAGEWDGREYWRHVAASAGRTLSDPDAVVAAEVAGWSHADDEMVSYVRRLASRVPVAALSNVPIELVTVLRREQYWLAELASVTLSAEVGLCKPDPAVYELALDGLGLAAGDVLFVDDSEANVVAARAIGMAAVVFPGLAALRPVVEQHLAGTSGR